MEWVESVEGHGLACKLPIHPRSKTAEPLAAYLPLGFLIKSRIRDGHVCATARLRTFAKAYGADHVAGALSWVQDDDDDDEPKTEKKKKKKSKE